MALMDLKRLTINYNLTSEASNRSRQAKFNLKINTLSSIDRKCKWQMDTQ